MKPIFFELHIVDDVEGEIFMRSKMFAASLEFGALVRLLMDVMFTEKLDPGIVHEDLPTIKTRHFIIWKIPVIVDLNNPPTRFFSAVFSPF